jgi:hypothetical protein
MRSWVGVCLVACLAACGQPATQTALTRSEQQSEARLTATRVAEKLAGAPVSACGSGSAPPMVGVAVMINARQCLSCRDLGYMLRRLKTHVAGSPVVVVPAADTPAICPYLRQERVRLPVLALPDEDRTLADTRTLMLYTAKGDGTVDSVYFGITGPTC